MSDIWYFLDGREQVGPVTFEELTAKLATLPNAGDILVWRDGFPDWKPAREVPELAAQVAKPPPTPEPAPRDSADDGKPPASAPRRRSGNLIARHWRGELPLWVSYWVIGFLGGIIAALIPLGVVWALSGAGYEPRTFFAALVFVWLAIFVIATWQLVGVWRSALRRARARRELGKRAFWARVAQLAVVLGFIRLLAAFGNSGVPQIIESSRMAFMDDPSLPAYAIRIMRDGSEIEVVGGFKYPLTDDVVRILREQPVKIVHLDSLGGRIGEAEKLYKVIRDRGLITYVSSRCMSACTLAFAGGRERWLRQGAVLGFHAPTFPGMSKDDLAGSEKSQTVIFAAAGFDAAFVTRALSTPNKELWKPSADELLRARVISGVSDGTRFAASGYGANATREDIATRLSKLLPVLQKMKERLPDELAAIIASYHDGYQSGRTEGELTAALREKISRVIDVQRALADDAVLVDLAKLYAEQYAALGAKDPTLCYLYASGTGGTRNFSSDIPQPLIQRENALSEQVIATAAPRPDAAAGTVTASWEKVMRKLGGRFSLETINLVRAATLDASRHRDYCRVSVVLFREISNLEQREAALLIRQMLGDRK